MASSAHHLFLLAFFVSFLAAATPRAAAWTGGRLFFSKTTRPQASVDAPETAIVPAPDAADPNRATAFSRPSTGGTSGRGYGLYGRPEENFPPDYFRRGVHRNAEKLTTTTTANVPTTTSADEAAVPVGGRGGRERAEPFVEDNGSGRGRAPSATTTSTTEETPEPFVEEDNGSGWGRPPRYYGRDAGAGRPEEEQQRDTSNYYGMSDTRVYQNGRYYYDVDAGRYGYGRESNPVRSRPDEFTGFGDRRGRYYGNVDAAARYNQYGDGNEFGNGVQEEARNGRFIP